MDLNMVRLERYLRSHGSDYIGTTLEKLVAPDSNLTRRHSCSCPVLHLAIRDCCANPIASCIQILRNSASDCSGGMGPGWASLTRLVFDTCFGHRRYARSYATAVNDPCGAAPWTMSGCRSTADSLCQAAPRPDSHSVTIA